MHHVPVFAQSQDARGIFWPGETSRRGVFAEDRGVQVSGRDTGEDSSPCLYVDTIDVCIDGGGSIDTADL